MGNWQPPLLRGRELLNWASATARTVTMEFLDRRRTAKTATELSSELHVGVTAAINQEACSDRQVGCPAFCHSEIVVTPPEVLGIADYLRQNRPPDELRRVKERAAANCRRLAVTDRTQSAGEDVCCPLMDGRDACCAFPVRPIRCRGRDVSPISNFDRKPLDPHKYESRSHVVVQGAEFGFCSGLKASGLDGNLRVEQRIGRGPGCPRRRRTMGQRRLDLPKLQRRRIDDSPQFDIRRRLDRGQSSGSTNELETHLLSGRIPLVGPVLPDRYRRFGSSVGAKPDGPRDLWTARPLSRCRSRRD